MERADVRLVKFDPVKLDISRATAVVYVLNREPFALWRGQSTPLLFDSTATIENDLTLAYQSDQVVDLILLAPLGQPPHPIHKHVGLLLNVFII